MSGKVKPKTLPEIIQAKCPKAYRICKDCLATCEFKGNDFLGEWVPFEDYQGIVERLGELYNWLSSSFEPNLWRDTSKTYSLAASEIKSAFQLKFPELFVVEKVKEV